MTSIRITVCLYEGTANSKHLTRFEVDPAVTTLRDIAERIRADRMLRCYDEAAHANLTLSTFEDGAIGAPIDLADPAVCRQPLSAVIPYLSPRATESGLTPFTDGHELCFAVNVMGRGPPPELMECGADDDAHPCDTSAEQKETMRGTVITRHQQRVANTTMRRARDLLEANEGSVDKALLAVCKNGDSDVAVCLVRELGADVNARYGVDEHTPLHIAATGGHLEVMRVLVKELSADVNAKASEGGAPLHMAAFGGHREAVRVLVKGARRRR